LRRISWFLLASVIGTGCSKDPGCSVPAVPVHFVGGTVVGLTGTGLVLQNRGSDDLSVSVGGPFTFTFATPVAEGESYLVSVKTQPASPAQTCTVSGGSGTVAAANVTSVQVTCVDDPRPHFVRGTVTGLTGTGLVLQNNGGDDLAVTADGAFVFATPVLEGGRYDVAVKMQPRRPSQTCRIARESGVVGDADVTSVGVTCTKASLFFAANDCTVNGDQLWSWDGVAVVSVVSPSGPFLGNHPRGFTAWDGAIYYTAQGVNTSQALWKTDGTPAGTSLLKDVAVSLEGALEVGQVQTGWFAPFGGALWLAAYDDTHHKELWKTDGTIDGTVLVKDINPGYAGSRPWGFTELDGTLYFCASDGVHGVELWKTDGTTAGTMMVKDINPGAGDSCLPYRVPVVFRGALYFQATDGAHGAELWKTDGTAAGTVMVKDINPGSGDGHGSSWNALKLVELGGALYFQADDGSTGAELWRTDGTGAGTLLVKDVQPGPYGSYPRELTVVGGVLYFAATDASSGAEIWRTDGSPEETTRVTDVCGNSCSAEVRDLAAWGGELFFSAYDGSLGNELWKTNGTAAGTVLVKDIMIGVGNGGPYGFIEFDGLLYFAATDGPNAGQHGYELWRTDGTTVGTERVTDICPGYGGSVLGDMILF
jgi:ELWxxDGT repeat protein